MTSPNLIASIQHARRPPAPSRCKFASSSHVFRVQGGAKYSSRLGDSFCLKLLTEFPVACGTGKWTFRSIFGRKLMLLNHHLAFRSLLTKVAKNFNTGTTLCTSQGGSEIYTRRGEKMGVIMKTQPNPLPDRKKDAVAHATGTKHFPASHPLQRIIAST